MTGLIFLFADGSTFEFVNNPWAAFAAMIGALASVLASVKYKAHRTVFYCLSGLCALFGFGMTYSQNNIAKIEAERDVKIDKETRQLTIESQNNKNLLLLEKEKLDTCETHLYSCQNGLKRLEDENSDLRRDKRHLKRDLQESEKERVNANFVYIGKYHYGIAPAKNKAGKWGYINKWGGKIVPFMFKSACDLHEERGGIQNMEGKWGYINPAGERIIECQFDKANRFEKGGIARVILNGKGYIIDKRGNIKRALKKSELASI